MRYALLIVQTEEAWERPSDAEREFDALARWWADLRARGKIAASARLAPPGMASTLSWRGQTPVVTDGPYAESKEVVGGVVLLDVDSADEAKQIASTWLGNATTRIELRPVIESRWSAP